VQLANGYDAMDFNERAIGSGGYGGFYCMANEP
jgi:hypothetical protein